MYNVQSKTVARQTSAIAVIREQKHVYTLNVALHTASRMTIRIARSNVDPILLFKSDRYI